MCACMLRWCPKTSVYTNTMTRLLNTHTHTLRIDPTWWHHKNIPLVTWTVNNARVQTHFKDVLHIPFMTDNVTIE